MDTETIDAISRRLAGALTRRRLAGVGAGTLLGLAMPALDLEPEDIEAARKKKRKKKKPNPTTVPPVAPPPPVSPPPCGGRCSGEIPQCCAPTMQDPEGICVETGAKCCKSEEGGGSCEAYPDVPDYVPKCCPATAQFENGLCVDQMDNCCPSAKGGSWCPKGQACCAGNEECPTDRHCDGNCCVPD